MPEPLLRSLQDVPGFCRPTFEEAHRLPPVTSIRRNARKVPYSNPLLESADKIPWTSSGYYLPVRPSFTMDPIFHGGAYYVQEPSSMFLEQALVQTTRLDQPLRVLDLCASPGGKSTLIQSLIHSESLLVSNEVIKSRVRVLEESMIKWGAHNVMITHNDPRDFRQLQGFFDVLVIDAPCSGSGLFRRDPGVSVAWNMQQVVHCAQRQQRIISDSLPCLKKGGLLIYSTCSYSPEENEHIVRWMLETFPVEPVALDVPPEWGIEISMTATAPTYRFFPDKARGEGFFLAVLRKTEGKEAPLTKSDVQYATQKDKSLLAKWVKCEHCSFHVHHEAIFALPQSLQIFHQMMARHLKVIRAGVAVGSVVRDQLIPDHALALSPLLSNESETIALNKQEAIRYLRKEHITASGEGWLTVEYEGIRLGWIKVLKNRVNNYYPKEWRILKQGN